jgi:hypothetical protein
MANLLTKNGSLGNILHNDDTKPSATRNVAQYLEKVAKKPKNYIKALFEGPKHQHEITFEALKIPTTKLMEKLLV